MIQVMPAVPDRVLVVAGPDEDGHHIYARLNPLDALDLADRLKKDALQMLRTDRGRTTP